MAGVDHGTVGGDRQQEVLLIAQQPTELGTGCRSQVRVYAAGERRQLAGGGIDLPDLRISDGFTGRDFGEVGPQRGEPAHVGPPAQVLGALVRLHRGVELAKLELGQTNAVQRHAAQVRMPGGEHLVVGGVRGGQSAPILTYNYFSSGRPNPRGRPGACRRNEQ